SGQQHAEMLDPGSPRSALQHGQNIAQREEIRMMVERHLRQPDLPKQIFEADVHAIQELRHPLDRLGSHKRDIGERRRERAAIWRRAAMMDTREWMRGGTDLAGPVAPELMSGRHA